MPPNTEGGGSGTKVLLAEGPDIRKRINIAVSGSDQNTKANYASISKGRGLSFHIKKLAWTLFTIPICRAIVFVVFAIVSNKLNSFDSSTSLNTTKRSTFWG
jgi:hypothetical protein